MAFPDIMAHHIACYRIEYGVNMLCHFYILQLIFVYESLMKISWFRFIDLPVYCCVRDVGVKCIRDFTPLLRKQFLPVCLSSVSIGVEWN